MNRYIVNCSVLLCVGVFFVSVLNNSALAESCVTRFAFEETRVDEVYSYELNEVISKYQRNLDRPRVLLPEDEEYIVLRDASGEELNRYRIEFTRNAHRGKPRRSKADTA